MNQPTDAPFRSGFVALIGRPNVGKSTLVNALLGEKVAIVSPRPQTTRNRIHGILNMPSAQVVLVDTPGMCAPGRPLADALRKAAGSAAADADLSLVLVEVRSDNPEISEADREVLRTASQNRDRGAVVLAINKVDTIKRKEILLPWIERYAAEYDLAAVIPISALRRDGLDPLLEELVGRLPEGPPLFPTDLHTDQAERFLCAELVREQMLLQLQYELPHSAAVVIETFEDGRDQARPLCRIEGRIYVERDSQKAIVVGKGGQQVKTISQKARRHIEAVLGCNVFLRLTVHVDKNWTRNAGAVRRFGIGSGSTQ